MKKIFLAFTFFLLSFLCQAHPGIGIVKDSKGNIFYTDLRYVWKVSPDGKRKVVVSNVHTHELYMDANDNLFGEHLWYNGEKVNTWGHYVWCLKNNGEYKKIIEPTEGFLNDYSFVRDASGNMYWIERFTTTKFMKKRADGKTIKLAEGKFGFIGWIYATSNGTIYFTESKRLQKLTPDGRFIVLTDDLGSNTTDFSVMGHNYSGYGIWTDLSDNIYVAMIDAKKVSRISPDGKVETILRSNSLWTACSGLFDNGGNLWLLENSMTNEVRVRKISKEKLAVNREAEKISIGEPHLLTTLITGIVTIIGFLLLKKALYIKSRKIKYS